MTYDELPFDPQPGPPNLAGEPTPRKCRHPRDKRVLEIGGPFCYACNRFLDPVKQRRGKQSRRYGNAAELSASRKYGGTKIGAAGGPVDIRGKDFATQMKTHRRLPPAEWVKAFAKMSQENRTKRLLLRFVQGPGVPPKDYFVFEADDFLSWFGRDE